MKRVFTHKQSIPVDETLVKEEMFDIRVTRTSKGKRQKLDAEIETFSNENINMEVDTDEDYMQIQLNP